MDNNELNALKEAMALKGLTVLVITEESSDGIWRELGRSNGIEVDGMDKQQIIAAMSANGEALVIHDLTFTHLPIHEHVVRELAVH